jgi:alkanesulfonate monooxygenase SsuD/methylene tetrahydromethanopterin reductase-like flavin-dependent oxidoreductase (luciferase family)
MTGEMTWDRVTHPWVAAGEGRLRFGVLTHPVLPDRGEMRRVWQLIEELGFDSCWVGDHPRGTYECWSALTALADATQKIRLGPLVSCVYYRGPVVLARAAADVDRISGGRLVLGLGIGDSEEEFEQIGVPFLPVPDRQRALEETIRIVQGVWGEAPFSFEGEKFRVQNLRMPLGPIQKPHVPLLIAGGGEEVTLRKVAEHADASNFGAHRWTGSAETLEDVRRKYGALRRHCARRGRPYESVLRSNITLRLVLAKTPDAVRAKFGGGQPGQGTLVGTPADVVREYRALADAGVQYFIARVLPDDEETLRLLAERVVPELA